MPGVQAIVVGVGTIQDRPQTQTTPYSRHFKARRQASEARFEGAGRIPRTFSSSRSRCSREHPSDKSLTVTLTVTFNGFGNVSGNVCGIVYTLLEAREYKM